MKIFKLELKRMLKAKLTWILLLLSLVFSVLLAYLLVTYCYSNYTDEAGNEVNLTGLSSIAYEKVRQKDASGVVTPERVRQAVETYQACLEQYGVTESYNLPEGVYEKEILPISPLLHGVKEAFADPNTGMAPAIMEIDSEQLEDYYAVCEQRIVYLMAMEQAGLKPDYAAGLSLGEYGALIVSKALDPADAFRIIRKRGIFMQEAVPQGGAMAAVLGLGAQEIEAACAQTDGIVSVANYNCPGQLVISGAVEAVDAACAKAKEAGARRALRLPVGGAFHSPLMEPAKVELEKAIEEAPFRTPVCPIYQNVDAKPYTDPAAIKANLIAQLTAPVRWTYIVKQMLADGVEEFTELGPGTVLQGLVKKVDPTANVESKSTL